MLLTDFYWNYPVKVVLECYSDGLDSYFKYK